MCGGHREHCLKLMNQAWLSMMKNATHRDRRRHLYLLSALSFSNHSYDPNASVPSLPPCQLPMFEHLSGWVHWTLCRGETAQVLANTSYGSLIDWSPIGSARVKGHGTDLCWHRNNDTISTHGGGSWRRLLTWRRLLPSSPTHIRSPSTERYLEIGCSPGSHESLDGIHGKFFNKLHIVFH